MKTLKSLFCAFSLSALFLVSCGNENEPTNPGGGGTVPTDRSQLVTSVLEGRDHYDFTYDSNKRLTYVDCLTYGKDDVPRAFYYEFSYMPFGIILGYNNNIFKYDLKVNEDGYITYLKDNRNGGVTTYEYNDGYLVKADYKSFSILYTWENGNLKEIAFCESDGRIYRTYKYSYSENSTNNTGVYFPHIEEYFFMLLGGFLGKTTAKIPECVEMIEYNGLSTKGNISVEYDNKGRIIKEFYNDKLIYVYAYEGREAVWPEN